MQDVFRIKDFAITNRLFVGTGKYATYELMQQALAASSAPRNTTPSWPPTTK